MADKEFLLLTKARELLLYTRKATKPINSDVPSGDVQNVLHKIAALDDLGKVREVCMETDASLRRRRKDGFSKHSYRDFGQEMRDMTRDILRGVRAANDVMFAEEPEKRLKLIDGVLSDTALLLDYIVICKEAGIISTKTAGIWSPSPFCGSGRQEVGSSAQRRLGYGQARRRTSNAWPPHGAKAPASALKKS